MASALAFAGMLLAHFAFAPPASPGWLRAVDAAADGRAAPLFCVLAGVGAGLLSVRGRDREVVARGLVLVAVGFLVWPYVQTIALILPHYGVLLVAVPLLQRLPTKALLPSALVAFLVPTVAGAFVADDRLRRPDRRRPAAGRPLSRRPSPGMCTARRRQACARGRDGRARAHDGRRRVPPRSVASPHHSRGRRATARSRRLGLLRSSAFSRRRRRLGGHHRPLPCCAVNEPRPVGSVRVSRLRGRSVEIVRSQQRLGIAHQQRVLGSPSGSALSR